MVFELFMSILCWTPPYACARLEKTGLWYTVKPAQQHSTKKTKNKNRYRRPRKSVCPFYSILIKFWEIPSFSVSFDSSSKERLQIPSHFEQLEWMWFENEIFAFTNANVELIISSLLVIFLAMFTFIIVTLSLLTWIQSSVAIWPFFSKFNLATLIQSIEIRSS